jgi:DNA-nicking Smr family endonuclease
MSKKRRVLTEEEQSLWNRIIQKINPLSHEKKYVKVQEPKPKLPLRKKQIPITLENHHPVKSDYSKSTHRIERVRKIKIDARLDLHGMTLKQAEQKLIRFLITCQQNRYLWVLVITGKGKPKTEYDHPLHTSPKSTLRDKVPQWLDDSALRTVVSAYTAAKPQDGGSGALYVRLKKLK